MSYAQWLSSTLEKLRSLPAVGEDVLGAALQLAPKRGTWAEFGVADGITLRRIVEARGEARVWGFDTFTGLPEPWIRPDLEFKAGHFAVERIPIIEGAHLVTGLFNETLPAWVPPMDVTFAHIDCDLYAGAYSALHCLHTLFEDGAIVVFDELFNYPGFEEHEMRALYEVTGEGLEYEWLFIAGGEDKYPNERAALKVRA